MNEKLSRRQLLMTAAYVTTSGIAVVIGGPKAMASTLRVIGRPSASRLRINAEPRPLANQLMELGFSLEVDEDWHEVIQVIHRDNYALRGDLLRREAAHLTAYYRGKPINWRRLNEGVVFAQYAPTRVGVIDIRRERYSSSRRRKGLRTEPVRR